MKEENIHEGHRKRMRQKFLSDGIDAFTDHEILEFFLFYVHKRANTNPIGHALIKKFGSLKNVFSASYDELIKVDGVGESSAVLIKLLSQLSNRISRKEIPKKARLASEEETGKFCMSLFYGLTEERFIIICVDSERNVLSWHEISKGVSNATVVELRKIVEIAMARDAVGIILAHNHPGDSTNPSAADMSITNKVIRVLEELNIAVVDHIICNDETFTSMEQRGFMSKAIN